jgi:hypothetical protein
MAQPFRIFISSPGDVGDERRRAALVISRLKREFARFFDISAVLWEYEPMLSSGHFQDIIDPPSTADIVVLILWSRLGTPLPARTKLREYKGIDGRVPVTGTEWEFEQALEARERRKGVPDLLVYRKFTEGLARFSRAEELEQIRQQWDALQSFWQRHFEADDGRFKAAFNRFVALDEFEAQLEQHLRELLRRRLPPQPVRVAPRPGDRIEWWSGSPYRGLQAFDLAHAAVFFGRDRAEREITEALVHRSAEAASFMLVLGASGSGKSSLVRAGLLPDLMVPGVVQGVTVWRHTIVHPAELAPDPFAGLAAALLRAEALPELAVIGYREAELADQLRVGGSPVTVPLRLALDHAAAGAGPADVSRQGRLVLVLDQMEVLFTSGAFSKESRFALDALLSRLAQSGLVWVIATLRSDFYHCLTELPALNSLASGTGQYQLATPGSAEIEQIICRPAEVAGLSFEIDEQSGIALHAVIRESAARDPASLPLLSFVLDELYRRDVEAGGGSTLTYRSYRDLGGLEGAIAQRAETLVKELTPDLEAALPALLLALVEIDQDKGTATARTAQRAALAGIQRDVADRLIAARLVVADDIDGAQTLRLAHEALLGHWPRLAALTAEHRDFLIVRRRLQADSSTWESHDRHVDFLLPQGRRLAEAEDILTRRRDDLGPEIITYSEASIAANRARIAAEQQAKERELRRELQRSRRIAALVSVLLALALCGGAFAWWERGIAAAALSEAVKNYRLALDQAAGSVQLLTDSYAAGAISTKLMQQLIQQSQKTVNGLPGETEDVTAARAQLFDVLSLAHAAVGDLATAQQFAESEMGLVESLVSKSPADARWARLQVLAQGRLADALFWKGDSVGALKQARPSAEAVAKLVVANPDDEVLQQGLADAYQRIVLALRNLGDLDAAAEEHRAWVAYAEALVARRPGSPKPLASLASARQEYGDTLQQQGNAAEAAVQYQAAVTAAAQLAEKDPENAGYLATLTVSHERMGDALPPSPSIAALWI